MPQLESDMVEQIENLIPLDITPICGVYFLYMGPVPIYIGASLDIRRRIANHWGKLDFDTVYYIPMDPSSDIHIEEKRLIKLFRPKMNIVHSKNVSVNAEAFVKAWMESSSVKDLSKKIGSNVGNCLMRAAYYRKAGITLPRHPNSRKRDAKALNALAKSCIKSKRREQLAAA